MTSPGSELVDAAGTRHSPVPLAAGTTQPRIVSLVPSITELLFALGLGPFVVGRTTFCIHPAEQVKNLPRVGGTKTVRIDRLLALKPTHVVVNIDENTREVAEQIAAAGPTLVVTHPLSPSDNLHLYRLLGGIFSCAPKAEALCRHFDEALRDLRSRATPAAPFQVLYLIWREPWMTVSRDTYIARMLAEVGWCNVELTDPARYPEVDLQCATLDEVQLVLLSSEPYPFKPAHQSEVASALTERRQDHRSPLRRDVQVRLIDGEMLSWYGSRAIEGLRYLKRFADEVANTPQYGAVE